MTPIPAERLAELIREYDFAPMMSGANHGSEVLQALRHYAQMREALEVAGATLEQAIYVFVCVVRDGTYKPTVCDHNAWAADVGNLRALSALSGSQK